MNNVYIKKIDKPYRFTRNTKSDFKLNLSDVTKEGIVNYSVKNVSNLYNGKAVRLDKIIENDEYYDFFISEISYFDSLTSNILYQKYWNKLPEFNSNEIELKINNIIECIKNDGIYDFNSVINNKYLANSIAVSILVEDINNNYGMVYRNNNLAIGAGLLSVTVTGSLDDKDFNCVDPVLSCIERELNEELGIKVYDCTLEYIAISKTKLQPIFIINAKLKDSWENVKKNFSSAIDYTKEIKNFCIVSIDQMKNLMNKSEMTDAAQFHIDNVIKNKKQ